MSVPLRFDWRGAARAVLEAIAPGQEPTEEDLRHVADMMMAPSDIMADIPFVEIKRKPE